MKRLLLALSLACATAFAADTKPTEASIKELLTLTEAAKIVDTVWGQMDSMMRGMLAQATQGQQLTPEAQAAIAKFQEKTTALVREDFSWAKLEPLYYRVYQASFTQEEIDGMIAFYKTPAGLAVIKKLPLVTQNTMTEIRQMMGPLMQKLQQAQKESFAEIQAAQQAKPATPTLPPTP